MMQPIREKTGRGDPPLRRSTTRIALVAVVTLVLSTLAAVGLTPGTASADDVTQVTAAELTCTATPPIVAPIVVTQNLELQTVYPTVIARGQTGQVRLQLDDIEVPTDLDGNTVINLNSLNIGLRTPVGFQIVDVIVESEPGDIVVNTSFSNATRSVDIFVPGPLAGGSTASPPDVVLELRPTGTVGNIGDVNLNSFSLIARASLPLIGAQNVPVDCPPPVPPVAIASIEIGPGSLVPTPEPVTSEQLIVQNCRENNQTRGFNLGFNQNAFVDVPPGTTQNITLSLDAFDWLARSQEQRSANTAVRNWSLQLNGPDPAVFTVNSVSTGPGMTASYNAGTNVITWASQDDFGNGWAPAPLTVNVTAVGTGPYPQQARLQYRQLNFQVIRPLLVIFTSTSTQDCTTHSTVVNSPTRPVNLPNFGIAVAPTANDDSATVANNDFVDIPVLANDVAGSAPFDEASILIIDEPTNGTAVPQSDGTVRYTPEFGILEPSDNFTYVVFDVQGRPTNLASVTVDIVGIFCEAPCSLTQTIIVDVDPDTLTMEQLGGAVELDTVILDGDAQTTTAAMQEITVVNERGGTAPWDITGQLTSDFKTDPAGADCPASDPSSWYWLCVPGDNLGWDPLAAVAHDVVPGDVAVAEAGSSITSGLRSSAQKLCGAPATESGGTFECGAIVGLGVPASAGAGRYSATLTLTLA